MATFDQNVTAIKQAQYGYEVRDAIAEGLEQCYNSVTYPSLSFEEKNFDNNAKEITIKFPNDPNRAIVIYTNMVVSGNNYSSIAVRGTTMLVCCYYANCTSGPSRSIENLIDGSVLVTLSSSSSKLSRKTNIRVGYDAIETSLLVTSTSQYSGGSNKFPEIMLSRVSYSGGFPADGGSWYPGTVANPNYIPLVMTNFGGPGECLTSVSSVPTSFDGKNLYSDLSSGGRTGIHLYTKFVYS